MSHQLVKEIYDKTRKKRVSIYRLENGSFYYEEEFFGDHPLEMFWIPCYQKFVGIYESQEKAEDEARVNIDWIDSEN